MKLERTPFIVAAALAMLCTVGCKKQETTPPDADASPPDDVEEPDEPEEPEEPDEPEVEILTKASFDEAVHEHMSEVSDCYVAALEGNGKLKGKLEAEFTIGADGVPTEVVIVEGSTLTDEGLLQCISDAAKSWQFDPPSEDGLKLRFPFNLAPG